MDALALFGTVAAVGATAAAVYEARRDRVRRALAWLALAALCLRVPPAAHFYLSEWDERYHALVARNALEQGWLPPRLVAEPVAEPRPDDWRHAHVWLHKPPLSTWLMAASLAAFGTSEPALRVPSALASVLLVLAVFALARRFVSRNAALAAAGFCAWNARIIQLAAGARATDHVDLLFVLAVALGALAALRASELCSAGRVALVGVATAAAYYVKETPALVIPAVFFFALCARGASWRARVAAPSAALGLALCLVLPWQLYVARAFPEVAAVARARGARYFLNVVDHQGGPWYYHFANLPLDFGWLAPVALAWLGWQAWRARPELRPLVWWLALVYGVFTLAATKMQSYVLIAAPVMFVALGGFVFDAVRRDSPRWLRSLHALASLALVAGAAVAVLRVEGPFEAKVRDPLWARELRWLAGEVEKLPAGKRAVFGVAWPVECMYYARATCLSDPPTPEAVARARTAGFAVAAYGDAAGTDAVAIPYDPATGPARRLVTEIEAAGAERALVYNADHAPDLRAYLNKHLRHSNVSEELPDSSRRLARKISGGATLVILIPPDDPLASRLRQQFPGARFIEDATYARAVDSTVR